MSTNVIEFDSIVKSLKNMEEPNQQYRVAVINVLNYMLSLKTLNMPPKSDFSHVPENYEDIEKSYTAIHQACDKFTTTIYDQLVNYPIRNTVALESIDSSLSMSEKELQYIINHPEMSDENIEYESSTLAHYFDLIALEADTQIKNIDILLEDLRKFSTIEMHNIITSISAIIDGIKFDDHNYKLAVEYLRKTINEVESESTANIIGEIASGFGVVCGIGLAIGTVLTIASAITTGPACLIVAGVFSFVATVASLTISAAGIIYNTQQLLDQQKKMAELTYSMEGYEADIVYLNSWLINVENSTKNFNSVLNDLYQISTAWSDVSTGFQSISAKITISKGMLSKQEWEAILARVLQCEDISKNLQEKISGLMINETFVSEAKFDITEMDNIQNIVESSPILTFKEHMLAI